MTLTWTNNDSKQHVACVWINNSHSYIFLTGRAEEREGVKKRKRRELRRRRGKEKHVLPTVSIYMFREDESKCDPDVRPHWEDVLCSLSRTGKAAWKWCLYHLAVSFKCKFKQPFFTSCARKTTRHQFGPYLTNRRTYASAFSFHPMEFIEQVRLLRRAG